MESIKKKEIYRTIPVEKELYAKLKEIKLRYEILCNNSFYISWSKFISMLLKKSKLEEELDQRQKQIGAPGLDISSPEKKEGGKHAP